MGADKTIGQQGETYERKSKTESKNKERKEHQDHFENRLV
jgi:hypothetical protein